MGIIPLQSFTDVATTSSPNVTAGTNYLALAFLGISFVSVVVPVAIMLVNRLLIKRVIRGSARAVAGGGRRGRRRR